MARQTSGGPASVGYLALVRGNANYRMLWFGEIVSLFGDWFNLIASASLVSQLTSSGVAIGSLFVIRMLAPFLVSPLAGVFADRYNRKRLLIAADLSRALVVFGFLLVRDPQHAWLLYVLTAIQLALSGFFVPARNAILPDIVSRQELGSANALSSTTWSVMLALGAALGGLVAGEWGIYPAFVVDALSFLLSAMFISRIAYRHEAVQAASASFLTLAVQQYMEGLDYLRRHADILAVALHKAAIGLAVNGAFNVIQVALAERVYVIGEGGSTSLGLLFAVAGIGTGMGPLLIHRFIGDSDRQLRLYLAFSYGLVILGLAITASLASFGVVLFGTFLRALGGGINWVFSTQLLLQYLPARVRGRVFSTEFALFTLANALGAAAGGWALDRSSIGIAGLLWISAALSVVPAVLWSLWLVRHRGQDSPHPAGGAAD